jgi:hypothetical protein
MADRKISATVRVAPNIETSIREFKVRLCGTYKFFSTNFFLVARCRCGTSWNPEAQVNTVDVPEEVGPCTGILLNPYFLLDGERLGCITCPPVAGMDG